MTDTTPPEPIDPTEPVDPAAAADPAAAGAGTAGAATAGAATAGAAVVWYKRPLTWVIAAVIAAIVALALILGLTAGDDDPSFSLLMIDRTDESGQPVDTEMTASIRATTNPESWRWVTPPDGNAPQPASALANSSGTVTFRWGPTTAVAEQQEWASTVLLTESLAPDATLAATSFDCILRRGDAADVIITLTADVERPDDPEAPSVATYTFENFEFLPADIVVCGVVNGAPVLTTTTTTTVVATTATAATTTTVPETTTTAPATTVPATTAPATTAPATTAPETTAPPTTAPEGTSVMGVIEGRSDLTTLEGLIDLAGLRETLSDPAGTITLFAPDDAAFAELAALPDGPDLSDPATAGAVLLAHTNLGQVLASGDVLALPEVPVENGGPQPVDDAAGTVGGAGIVEADQTADNGVVHVLDAVMPIQP